MLLQEPSHAELRYLCLFTSQVWDLLRACGLRVSKSYKQCHQRIEEDNFLLNVIHYFADDKKIVKYMFAIFIEEYKSA